MRKGEKLLEYFADQESKFLKLPYPPYRSGHDKLRLKFIYNILENIEDDEFDRITK